MGRVGTYVLLLALLMPGLAEAYEVLDTRGCPSGTAAGWREQPSPWLLWHEGYSQLPLETVETVLQDSANIWGTPCCSSFQAVYRGTTDRGNYFGPGNILFFEEDQWPREFGHYQSTIAVTMNRYGSCEIVSSSMAFNGLGFNFTVDGSKTDLQSIATHEFGHWVGLGHTTVPASSMLPYYQGGTTGRDLSEDDQAGACYLYPKACFCDDDSDCKSHEACVDQTCALRGCELHRDCPDGVACVEGTCRPGCRLHSDCEPTEWCSEGSCVERFDEGCSICEPCSTHRDCGPAGKGYACFGTEEFAQCSKQCSSDKDCPGNSVCRTEFGGQCGSPESADDWFCSMAFSCVHEPVGCPLLGSSCSGPEGCGGTSDTCIDLGEGSICSCTCRTTADCGAGGACVFDQATGTRSCHPHEGLEPCGDFYCAPGQICVPFKLYCTDDPCAGVSCSEGEVCRDGVCGDPCHGVVCNEGFSCEEGACKETVNQAATKKKGPKKKESSCSTGAGDVSPGILLFAALFLLARRRGGSYVRIP